LFQKTFSCVLFLDVVGETKASVAVVVVDHLSNQEIRHVSNKNSKQRKMQLRLETMTQYHLYVCQGGRQEQQQQLLLPVYGSMHAVDPHTWFEPR
jgi:hypothetical protein